MTAGLIPFSALVASALVTSVWQGGLLALSVALLLRVLPQISAAARSAVWLVTFALAVLLHFELMLPQHAAAGVAPQRTVHLGFSWAVAVGLLWLGCSLLRAVELLISAVHLRRLGRASRPVTDQMPVSLRDLPRRATVCVSDAVDRPCVVGFLRPRILFPPALLESLSAAELEQVLLHETEHLRRGDDWTNLAQKFALVVFPLNPVLLWLERRLCVERELACDDRVLAQTAAPKAYAVCLTSLAEHTALRRQVSRRLTLALGAWSRRSELARRVYRILAQPQRTLSGRPAAGLAGALMAAMLAGATGLLRAPELVSFMPAPALNAHAAVPERIAASHRMLTSIGGAHLQLAKAILPMRSEAQGPAAGMHTAHVATKRRLHRVYPVAPTPALTSARLEITDEPQVLQLRFVRSTDDSRQLTHDGDAVMNAAQNAPEFRPVVRYAAVRVAGGWLLFQL